MSIAVIIVDMCNLEPEHRPAQPSGVWSDMAEIGSRTTATVHNWVRA